ncbi:mitochondrial ribosomal protein L18 isoform X1 [Lasioglossum baleicum]|uniref:mitochondrial ribosomal protein L18 isoform X1 n=1 Tax=Lasioglossum baleicum TaxID=434251 RepID=UPI003FCE76F9
MLSLRNRIGTIIKREVHGNAEIIANCNEVRNRNPRNLERLRIARKPIGYVLEKPGFSYWHKLIVNKHQRHIVAEIHHFENGPVIIASTREWGIHKQLYRGSDVSAYINLGRVLAQRCLECGILEIYHNEETVSGEKEKLLMEELVKGGISLTEPARYRHFTHAARYRDEKTWETFE